MGKEPSSSRGGRGGILLVAGAAMLCPMCKLALLLSAGGVLGGLLSNTWFLAGTFVVIAASVWLAFRLVKRRLARNGQASLLRCGEQSKAVPDETTAAREVKEREYTS